MSGASPISEHLALVHTSVAGRTRFEVAGLYRSPRIKEKLETELSAVSGINRVTANSLTGRVLVLYDPDVTIEGIIAAIEQHLDRRVKLRRKTERSAVKEKLDFKQAYNRANGILGSIPALLYSLPIFRTAPARAPGNENVESQSLEAWHRTPLDELLQKLDTTQHKGLEDDEAARRLERYGLNSLTAAAARSDLSIMLGQFNSAPVYMLGGSAVIAIVTGGIIDAVVILGVVIINAAIGFVTERQAEKTISSLSDTGVRSVRVLRNGVETDIDVEAIVPGDILVFSPGTYVSADARILKSHRLSVDESALTGESMPVKKDHEFLAGKSTALGDRRNMAYMGTHI
ncbi:MAG: cation-transporting P-type ATPase, partial [Gammaproteobacteria bacterium]